VWRKLHDEMGENVALVGKKRNEYDILVARLEGKRSRGTYGRRWLGSVEV
jgi:hypothetical protein